MTEMKPITCVVCPAGCLVNCSVDGGEVWFVSGHECARGEKYARAEVVAPVRSLTTTILVEGGPLAVLPVRTSGPVPKGQVLACLAEIKKRTVSGPVRRGQVLMDNVLGLGVELIACRDLS